MTAQLAVLPPSTVVAVMVAEPGPTGLTTPALTVATLVSLLDHETAAVAVEGARVATKVPVSCPERFIVVALRLIEVAAVDEVLPNRPVQADKERLATMAASGKSYFIFLNSAPPVLPAILFSLLRVISEGAAEIPREAAKLP